MPMPPRATAPKRVSFARADLELLLYDRDAAPLPPPVLGILERELDIEVNRQHGGVPIQAGHLHCYVPLDSQAQGAGFARVRDLRTSQQLEYDIVEVDDDSRDWVLRLTLAQRQAPIGLD